jgi:hypothetical protein
MNKRFQDSNLKLSDFNNKVLVVCPSCKKKATVNNRGENGSMLSCFECHYTSSKCISAEDRIDSITTDYWFGQELWLQAAFKNEVFWANNYEHLDYMKQYISSGLRERHNRTFFTLVEKLPGFIKSAKNRDRLLKLIEKLEKK